MPVPLPGSTPQIAPPGVYYVLERVKVETKTGVKALRPGEAVRLVYRNNDGTILVTTGREEFLVKETAMTRDRIRALNAAAVK